MLYVRGNKRDYDRWAKMGNKGWSWRDVLPLFIKSEDNQDIGALAAGYHGSGGYLTVKMPDEISLSGQQFNQAGEYLGYPVLDYNGKCGLFRFQLARLTVSLRLLKGQFKLDSACHREPHAMELGAVRRKRSSGQLAIDPTCMC